MPLPREYADEDCALARSLEIGGERWTLLVTRDASYGVRRFSDFADHLRLPRPVLARRLRGLVAAGLMACVHGPGRHREYELTDKGPALWPAPRAVIGWGDEFCSLQGIRRYYRHILDGGLTDPGGACAECGTVVPVQDVVVTAGPGLANDPARDDPVSRELRKARRLLDPLSESPEVAAGRLPGSELLRPSGAC